MKPPLAFEIFGVGQPATSKPEEGHSGLVPRRHHMLRTRVVEVQDFEMENVVDFGVVRPATPLQNQFGRRNIMSIHTSRNGGCTYLAQNDRTPLLRCALHLIRPHLSLFDARAHVRYRRLHSYRLRSGSKGQALVLLADHSRWNMWPYAALAGEERGARCSKFHRTPLVGAKRKAQLRGEIGASRRSFARRKPAESATGC